MSDSESSFKKWIGGVLATIITGFVLWFLTGPISPFVKEKTSEQPKQVTTSPASSGNDDSKRETPETQPQQAVPEQKISVEASPNPYTIMAGEQTQINVLAYNDDKNPVENASVEIRAGGGFFSLSGNYLELGKTNDRGVFVTYWKAPDPVAVGYGMTVTVSKQNFITGRAELTVNTKNH